jgi:hypothetical protein
MEDYNKSITTLEIRNEIERIMIALETHNQKTTKAEVNK